VCVCACVRARTCVRARLQRILSMHLSDRRIEDLTGTTQVPGTNVRREWGGNEHRIAQAG
jgi:hypothetical protein